MPMFSTKDVDYLLSIMYVKLYEICPFGLDYQKMILLRVKDIL